MGTKDGFVGGAGGSGAKGTRTELGSKHKTMRTYICTCAWLCFDAHAVQIFNLMPRFVLFSLLACASLLARASKGNRVKGKSLAYSPHIDSLELCWLRREPIYQINYANNMNHLISGITFSCLFLLMVSYWSQAAFFGREKYKILNELLFLLALSSLSLLLILRWIESGHFPLSNLYESLLFLSLCFLTVKLGFEAKVPPIFTRTHKDRKLFFAEPTSNANQSDAYVDRASVFTKLYSSSIGEGQLLQNLSNQTRAGVVHEGTALLRKNDNEQPYVHTEQNELFSPKGITQAQRDLELGVVLSPASLLTFGFAVLSLPKEMQQATALVPALQSNWLMMHVTVMVLSYAALLSGSLLSIAFLIVHRSERKAESGNKARPLDAFRDNHTSDSRLMYAGRTQNIQSEALYGQMPWTNRLDSYSYRALSLGFPLLTIGILSGAVWANEAWGSYWSWDPKETWAFVTWLVFAIYLHTRITKGWSGEKPAVVASVGFFVLWFCYLGVNLLGTGLHSYGWFSK